MKTILLKRTLGSFLTGAALLSIVATSDAQTITTSYTNTFDTAAKVSSWHHWYDIYAPTYNGPLMDWDSTHDSTFPPIHAGSGSLVYSNTWPGTPVGGGRGQDTFYGLFAEGGIFDTSQTIDPSKYDYIAFDLHADPMSPTNLDGNVCALQVGIFYNDYNFAAIATTNVAMSTTNGWTHFQIDIAPTAITRTNLCAGIGMNISCYGGRNANLIQTTNTTYFWLDNITIHRRKVKNPPPVMSTRFAEPEPGLNLFSSTASTDQYQRSNVRYNNNFGVGWLGQSNVTYAMNILKFPSAAALGNNGYQAHIMITTGPGSSSALDYVDPNLIFLDIHQNIDGTASGTFRYKTNQPNGNAMVYSTGTLGTVGSSTIFGTWSITFNQDTNILVRSPDGSTFVTNITQDAASIFAEPLYIVFGGQPNQPQNVGGDVILSSIGITNAGTGTTIVYDNFLADQQLDLGTWTPLSGAPNVVFVFPQDPGQKLVSWTQPDAGFGLQINTNSIADPNGWVTYSGNEATGVPLVTFGSSGKRTALVPSVALSPKQNYFRMFTRKFTKLQVLMPGETAAPGTATGKIGTPDPQTAGVAFNVIVNSVDDNYFLAVREDDTLHLTSTDTSATLPATDLSLAGGTVTIPVTLNASGTWTVTASDVTDPTKPSSTSAATTVP